MGNLGSLGKRGHTGQGLASPETQEQWAGGRWGSQLTGPCGSSPVATLNSLNSERAGPLGLREQPQSAFLSRVFCLNLFGRKQGRVTGSFRLFCFLINKLKINTS